jgi:hypothetical protein
MQSSKRPDFISKNQTTDGNATSYGGAMLFIYYLCPQLGFSLPAIINKAGGTLEKTYHALTGKNGGYKAFSKLLAKFFPIGDTPLLPLDNPFPLLDGRHAMCTPLPQNRRTPRLRARSPAPRPSTLVAAVQRQTTSGRSPTRTNSSPALRM